MTFRRFLAAACAVAMALPAAAQPMHPDNPPVPREHAATVDAYGGLYEGPAAVYVAQVGRRVAEAAGQRQCGFHVVNTDVVNAFTSPPGCHVYITRGLLGLMNSEDELAAVLGHEVGHVAANHAGRREQRSVLTGLGAMVLGALTGSGEVANLANTVGQLNVLSYSRSQEFESDKLSAQYLARSGYSPYAMVDVLGALQGQDQLQQRTSAREAKATPAWAQSHPLTGDRIQRAVQTAQASGQPPGAERQDPLLAGIDGLTYGDDPRQGFVEGRRFTHPTLGIAFEAPEGFTLTNSSRAVRIEGPGGVGQFSAGRLPAGGLDDYAVQTLRGVVGRSPARAGQIQRTRINGLPAVVLPALAQSQRGQVEVAVAAYDAGEGRAYHFVTLASPGRTAAFEPLFGSFRRLSPNEASAVRARVIRVVAVKPGDTVESLAARMATPQLPVETFRLLNGLQPGETLRPGRRVKLVSYEPSRR